MDNSEHPRIGAPRARRVLMSADEQGALIGEIQALEGLGVWTYNPATRDVHVSEMAARLLRIPPSNLTHPASFFFGMVHPDDRGEVLRWFLRCTHDPSPSEVTFRVVGAPGERQTLAGRGMLRRNPASGHPEVVGTLRDVTVQRDLESSLRAALAEAQRFREALDRVPTYVYMKDTHRRYVYANRLTLDLFGVSAEELPGCTDTRFFPPPTVERLREVDERVLRGERTQEEIDVADAHGGRRVYMESKTPMYTDAEETAVWGLLGISTDITARRVAEEVIIRENARRQVLFERAKDGVFVIDSGMTVIDANESIARMLRTSVHALMGTHPWDWDLTLPTREAFQARWPEALPEEGTVETTLRRTDGSTFEAEITFNRVRWGDIDLVYVVCRDITERKRYRSELEAYRDRLKALAASLRSSREDERAAVARELHDDLGQLFTAMKLDVTLLEHAVMPELPPARQPVFVRHIVGIMRTIDAGMRTLRGIVLQLRPEVLDTLGLTGALEWCGTEFTRRTAVPCWLQAAEPPFAVPREHATALFRMYQEILTNITRHARATSVKAVLTFTRDAMHFVVEDDGRGFDADRAVAPDSLGILGMRERAAALSGSLTVESRPGTGTTVRIDLPLQPTAPR